MKTINLLWSLSLMLIGLCTILLAGANLFSVVLPDWMTRVLGGLDLIALPVLAYSTVKKLKRQ